MYSWYLPSRLAEFRILQGDAVVTAAAKSWTEGTSRGEGATNECLTIQKKKLEIVPSFQYPPVLLHILTGAVGQGGHVQGDQHAKNHHPHYSGDPRKRHLRGLRGPQNKCTYRSHETLAQKRQEQIQVLPGILGSFWIVCYRLEGESKPRLLSHFQSSALAIRGGNPARRAPDTCLPAKPEFTNGVVDIANIPSWKSCGC